MHYQAIVTCSTTGCQSFSRLEWLQGREWLVAVQSEALGWTFVGHL